MLDGLGDIVEVKGVLTSIDVTVGAVDVSLVAENGLPALPPPEDAAETGDGEHGDGSAEPPPPHPADGHDLYSVLFDCVEDYGDEHGEAADELLELEHELGVEEDHAEADFLAHLAADDLVDDRVDDAPPDDEPLDTTLSDTAQLLLDLGLEERPIGASGLGYFKGDGSRVGVIHKMVPRAPEQANIKATCNNTMHGKCFCWVTCHDSRSLELTLAEIRWLAEGPDCSALEHAVSCRNLKRHFGMHV